MKLATTSHLFNLSCLYISFLLLYGSQSVSARILEITTNKVSIPQKRILEDISISCSYSCLREVSKYIEEDTLLVNLGPSANYTLIFPIPTDTKDFTLLFNPGQDIIFAVSLQKPLSEEYVPFDDYLIKDGEWMKLFLSGSILSEYKGGKILLELSNSAGYPKTVTVKFDEEKSSTSIAPGVILALLIGSCIYIPILGCLCALIAAFVRKMYNLYWCKHDSHNQIEYHENFPNQLELSDIHVHINQQGAYGTHRVLESGRQEQVINFASIPNENVIDNKRNHNNTTNRTTYYYASNLPLNAETISYHFPEIKFEDLKSPYSQTICSVCLEELNAESICRQLYCQHVFHSECIQLWLENQLLKKKACCPNCNVDMRTYQY